MNEVERGIVDLLSRYKELSDKNERLSAALSVAVNCMDGMAYDALQIGLEGSSDWDRTAGNRDMHGAIDQGRKALGVPATSTVKSKEPTPEA